MKKTIVFLVLTVLFTGCGPKSPSRVIMQGYQSIQSSPVKKGYAELILYRQWKFVSGGVYSAFLINDIPTVNFKSGAARIYLKPGKHIISAKVTDYDSSDWGKPFQVEVIEGRTTVVKFDAGGRKLYETPDFAYQNMTFYEPEVKIIQTAHESVEDKQKKIAESTEISTYKENIKKYINKKDFSGLKVYVNQNSRAAYYIPDYKMRLLFIGPKGFQVGDIIKYKEKKISDMLLLAKIRSSKSPYKQFSMEEIEILQEYKVSDKLIAAMIEVTTEIEKEMARDEKQRKLLEAQRDFMQKNQEQNTNNGSNQTVAQELTKEMGKQLIKGLLKNAF